MDSAAAGDKPSVAGSTVNDMKTILESIQAVDECGSMVDEGPMPAMPAPEQHEGNPVTVNVNMNASGKEHVADLLDMMKNAGLGDAAPAADAMMSPRQDMERLSAMMDEPGDEPEMEEVEDEIEVEGDYANEPDEKYDDHEVMTKDLSGGINREKKSYKAAQRGDNAMAMEDIKEHLYNLLAEKKKTMVKGPDGKMVPDYAADGKGKDDLSKGKKGSKPKKGEVPPQFKK